MCYFTFLVSRATSAIGMNAMDTILTKIPIRSEVCGGSTLQRARLPSTVWYELSSHPRLVRDDNANPELFYFVQNKVAIFGLNMVAGRTFMKEVSDRNVYWVRNRLQSDTNCELQSIIILAQVEPSDKVYDELNGYFDGCGKTLPTLTITGENNYLFKSITHFLWKHTHPDVMPCLQEIFILPTTVWLKLANVWIWQ